MTIDLPTQYDPKSVEKAIYQKWLDARVFHAVPDSRPVDRRFSVVIPPPNVTGALHLGHAINGTIQDILTRYHRMRGDNSLWMPGIDHAGIATQAVVEKTIFEKEKKSRHDLGREELVRRIWEWKEQFGTRILSQLQSIGASCDWERTRFTLDEVCARAVREAFFKMFKDGLIFRGKRLVNWDTHLQTAVADDEIYHETVKGAMTSIRYPVAGKEQEASSKEQEYLIVATTRPETMLGDTAVAVHPDDPRYKHLIGGHVIVPLVGRRIPIIADGQLVDPAFGTGVVKVTPAHDPNDYATGVRHGLEQINLLSPDGKVNENGAGEFLGKKYSYTGLKFATAARKAVLADLEALGLVAESKVHEHEVGHSDRSKTPIEPYLSDQWFVKMGDIASDNTSETRPSGSVAPQGNIAPGTTVAGEIGSRQTLPNGRGSDGLERSGITLADGTRKSGLAQAAMDAVADGRVKITPERYAKGYVDWLSQKRDWCISRQLWWGHRIPVWHQRIAITPENRLRLVSTDELEILDAGDPIFNWYTGDNYSLADAREVATVVFTHVDTGRSFKFDNSKGPPHYGMSWITPEISGQFDVYVCINHNSPKMETRLAGLGYVQDPDVLDTWFSSALWPISTLGWPQTVVPRGEEETSETRPLGSVAPQGKGVSEGGVAEEIGSRQTLPDGRVSEGRVDGGVSGGTGNVPEPELLPYFYPTSVLSTARDILTLWVARMVMFGLYCHGDVPFRRVYVHPVIQDGEGKIMSKSKGNGVDPVEIIASHGADALRFTLASLCTETQDIRMPVVKDAKTGVNTSPKFDIGRNFANKIWNASRYVLTNISADAKSPDFHPGLPGSSMALEDRWILSRLNATVRLAGEAINSFHFAELAQGLYQFFWTDFCDWYLEIAKARIRAGDAVVQSILLHCLETSLKLLHPMMPFISEEIWSKLPDRAGMLVTAPWPVENPAWHDPDAEAQLATIQAVTTAIREIQNRYPAAKGKPVILQPRDAAMQAVLEKSRAIIEPLTGATIAENSPAATKPENAATSVLPEAGGMAIYIGGVIDKTVERAKLSKRRDELTKLILSTRNKLGNEAFITKAPLAVVQGLRDQLARQEEELAAIEKNLLELQ